MIEMASLMMRHMRLSEFPILRLPLVQVRDETSPFYSFPPSHVNYKHMYGDVNGYIMKLNYFMS